MDVFDVNKRFLNWKDGMLSLKAKFQICKMKLELKKYNLKSINYRRNMYKKSSIKRLNRSSRREKLSKVN